MSFWSKLFPKFVDELNGSIFYIFNSSKDHELDFSNLYNVYANVPHLNIVINERAKLFSNGIFRVKKRDSDEILYEHPLNKILTSPNAFQDWKEFLFMVQGYQCIEGDAFVKKNYTVGTRTRNLVNLTPLDFRKKEISYFGNLPYESTDVSDYVKKITFWWDNQQRTFEGESLGDLIHFRDSGVFFGEAKSKIESLKDVITNIYKALKARQTMIERKGGIGALTGNQRDAGMAIPLKKTEKEDIQNKLNNYGLGIGKDPIIVTDVPLKWQSFVFPTRELMLFEEIQDGFHAICDAYGVKRELFEGQSNYSNKEHAERGTYQDTIIPLWNSFANKLNSALKTQEEGIEIVVDYSHIAILQDSEKLNVETQKLKSDMLLNEFNAGIITTEEYRQQMGY